MASSSTNNDVDLGERTRKLAAIGRLYRDPRSDLFLVKNTQKLFDNAKSHAELSTVTISDIQAFKATIESVARTKSEKILKGNRRYSFRKYKLFGHSIVAGDLAFIPRLTKDDSSKRKPGILAVFMCCFSRLVSLNFQRDAKASTTLKTFEKAIEEDFAGRKFGNFLSDRGNLF